MIIRPEKPYHMIAVINQPEGFTNKQGKNMIFFLGKPCAYLKWVMRISFYVMLVAFTATNLMASVTSNGQSISRIRMSVNIQRLPLRMALEQLSARSGVRIYFNDAQVDKVKNVSISTNDASLLEVLATLLKPANMVAQVYDNNKITIISKSDLPPPVKGVVMDRDSKTPLPGVAIRIKGQSSGAITDASGHFTIDVPETGAVLVISYIGYQSQEVKVTAGSTITVALRTGRTQLNEVPILKLLYWPNGKHLPLCRMLSLPPISKKPPVSLLPRRCNAYLA
jgi:hypothetical protein